jgi:hypothetical protein
MYEDLVLLVTVIYKANNIAYYIPITNSCFGGRCFSLHVTAERGVFKFSRVISRDGVRGEGVPTFTTAL